MKRCGILPDESKGVTVSQLIVNGKFQAFITSIFAWKIKICAATIVVKLDSVWPKYVLLHSFEVRFGLAEFTEIFWFDPLVKPNYPIEKIRSRFLTFL